ncbi:hypothetical protein D3C80_1322040 [compost metagenome]
MSSFLKKTPPPGGNGVAVAANARGYHLPIECSGAHHLIFKCTRESIVLTTTAMEACLLGWGLATFRSQSLIGSVCNGPATLQSQSGTAPVRLALYSRHRILCPRHRRDECQGAAHPHSPRLAYPQPPGQHVLRGAGHRRRSGGGLAGDGEGAGAAQEGALCLQGCAGGVSEAPRGGRAV